MTNHALLHADASDFIDPQGSIVDSARLFGTHLQQVAKSTERIVEVSLVGMKGVSSSYFNLLLRMMIEAMGLEQLKKRIRWRFDSPLQESVFERSWNAISKEAA